MIVLASDLNPQTGSVIRVGELSVDINSCTIKVNDKVVRLTRKEYLILALLILHKDTAVTKKMFLMNLYNTVNPPGMKIIEVFICKLRKKLAEATGGRHYIETVRGQGYALRDGRSVEWRTLQFATRVSPAFDQRLRAIAKREKKLLVEILEDALDAYENSR